MAFRFKITDGDLIDYTPWYQEANPMSAPTVMSRVRLANPKAKVSIERGNVDGALPLDNVALDAVLREKRIAAGWSEEEISMGHKFPTDPEQICDTCRQKHSH
jgi:hypothetical protein